MVTEEAEHFVEEAVEQALYSLMEDEEGTKELGEDIENKEVSE